MKGHALAGANDASPAPWTYSIVPGLFFAGPYPSSVDEEEGAQKLRILLDAGVRHFVNLTEEREADLAGRPFRHYEQLAVSLEPTCLHQRFAIVDGSIPSTDQMKSILDAIDASLFVGRPVYVHCWGGVGRTGTVVCCWLLRHGHADRTNVLDVLRALRLKDEHRGRRRSPETFVQEEFVGNWEEE